MLWEMAGFQRSGGSGFCLVPGNGDSEREWRDRKVHGCRCCSNRTKEREHEDKGRDEENPNLEVQPDEELLKGMCYHPSDYSTKICFP